MSSLERLATDVLREDVCYLKGSIGLQGRVPGICAHCSFQEAFSFGSSDRGRAGRFRGRIPVGPCTLPWAAVRMARAWLLWAARARHLGRARQERERLALDIGVCLKIPSSGPAWFWAPPVRRRRHLGGVRVIHAPHVDSQVASSWKAPCKRRWDLS